MVHAKMFDSGMVLFSGRGGGHPFASPLKSSTDYRCQFSSDLAVSLGR